jgi:plastocyanin
MKRILLALGLVALAAISTACSTVSAQPLPSGPIDQNGSTIVARDMKFATSTVEVKAGANFTLHFDNQDSAPHNVAIYTDSSASNPISVGEIVASGKKDQVVAALKPGSYFFRCDVHHDMTGTIVAR